MDQAKNILGDFERLFPEFAAYWRSQDNLFLEEDGSFRPCGVFSRAAEYIWEPSRQLTEKDWNGLAELVRKYFDAGEELRGVLGACLVEDLQFEECSSLFCR